MGFLRPLPVGHPRTSAEASGGAFSWEGLVAALTRYGRLGGFHGGEVSLCAPQAGRPSPRQELLRLVPLGVAHASGARLAVPVFPESPDKSREVGGVPGWDLGGGCQMLKAVRPDGPGWVAPEDRTDPTLLCS